MAKKKAPTHRVIKSKKQAKSVRKTPAADYGQKVVAALGPTRRRAFTRWRSGVAGTAPDGSRIVVYENHIRSGGDREWRTNNPGNVKIGAFARANGAIGRDGEYAVFPDRRTGVQAFSALLRTPQYSKLLVRDVLQEHTRHVTNVLEAQSHAMRYRLNSAQTVGSLNSDALSRLSSSVTSMFATSKPSAFTSAKSKSNPKWARAVMQAAQPQTTSPAKLGLGDPTNWQVGTWYAQQPDGSYVVAPNQNPARGDPGTYVRYDGNDQWTIQVGPTPGDANAAPSAETLPDTLNVPPAPPAEEYTVDVDRGDGTSFTMTISTAADVPDYPEGAYVDYQDGMWLVLYNDDGTPWNQTPGSDGEHDPPPDPGQTSGGDQGGGNQGGGDQGGGDQGGGDQGGDGGGGGDPEADPDSTGTP